MIKKILVTLDRNDPKKSVFNAAVDLAKSMEASLMLLNVLSEETAGYPVLPTYAYYPYPMLDDQDYALYEERLTEYKKWGLAFLENLTEEAKKQGIKTEYTQLTGNPGRMICELADTWNADLIVVGSRGLKGLKEMFLGSVSNYITHHAPCSVLVVRSVIDPESNVDSNASEAESVSNNNEKLSPSETSHQGK